MEKSQKSTASSNKRLFVILFSLIILLFIPLLAMQFNQEVKWTLLDFVVAGILLLGSGLGIEFVLRKVKSNTLRIALIITLFLVLILVWAELAVGIFGTPFAGS